MSAQSPLISIPRKSTDEVDWTTPIRSLISHSYGESPDNYATECASLHRCRQDAVRGAGSDATARDLLYKYFGQLELLELRFSEIRVTFPWRDAFTNKLVTQTALAYEKACVLFQIAATHSALAASQSRADPEGVKRAFYSLRTCAGMLTYVNDNFLHAPSTDLSRDVVKFLVDLSLAQASEVFYEKCAGEKKSATLCARVAAQVAHLYNQLQETVKEFMGKGIFDRNWVTIIQIKAKHFNAIAQWHKGLADEAAGKHGDALVRYTVAEKDSKEATRLASNLASMFAPPMSPNLPADAGTAIHELCKATLATVSEKKDETQRTNDLVYNAVLPAPETLPAIDKAAVATPIAIQDVYGNPEVQKVIGTDLFLRLVPLSVHESASVYSEEKAKIVRAEAERTDTADTELRSAIDALGVRPGMARFRAMADGAVSGEQEVPAEVRRWRDDITLVEQREPVQALLSELEKLKTHVRTELEGAERDLEVESRDCETMRMKYEHLWTQEPSAGLTKSIRQNLRSHKEALEAAGASDAQVAELWAASRADVSLLTGPESALDDVLRRSAESGGRDQNNLLDIDDAGSEQEEARERARIAQLVFALDERLARVDKIRAERAEVLKDLKEKIQTDDVSHLLLLNRRNSGVEPTLFAQELEKFRPLRERIGVSIQRQTEALREVEEVWKVLRNEVGRGAGARRWDERERRKRETVVRFERARDRYMEVRDGLAKGLQFYRDLTELSSSLNREVKRFVTQRSSERQSLVSHCETQQRLSAPASKPAPPRPPPPPSTTSGLDASFANLSMRSGPSSPPPPLPAPSWQHQSPGHNQMYSGTSPAPRPYVPPPPPSQPQQPPPPPASDPWASLGMLGSQYSSTPPSASQPDNRYSSPPPPTRQPTFPPPPTQQPYGQPSTQYAANASSSFPPPPPPVSYNFGAASPPPPSQHPSQPPYQGFPPPQQPYGHPQYR